MTIERQWTVESYMKRTSGELDVPERLVKESMSVITNNETLCKKGPTTNLEEGSPVGEHQSQSNANTNEPWLDRQINSLTAVLGCGPLISPQQAMGNGDETSEPLRATDADTREEPQEFPPPSLTTTDNENALNNDVSILYWSQKTKALTNADNSLGPTAIQSSSSEDKESQDSTNDSKPQRRRNILRWRLFWIISSLLLILGVLLALFLPNWNGRFRIKQSSSLATNSGISSPSLAPTTGKPSMAP
eukprot:CAMPEP_0170339016 /NCGR_PEP_ID=MMETSP0116_2-20130129/70560_1 /TAXON_ID=400756 /ORGANISM="Durinskia baltica, Strain CSIRO CS-38" /LENGTH=246 /DNA_ID=CAMNT_0010592423 /DNA_START=18 /DNA_END=755 /DNA_ORIENTATION=+